jgi:hypothetical protein
MRAYSMLPSRPRKLLLLSSLTIKVDVLGVQDFFAVDAESNTVDLGRALFD